MNTVHVGLIDQVLLTSCVILTVDIAFLLRCKIGSVGKLPDFENFFESSHVLLFVVCKLIIAGNFR